MAPPTATRGDIPPDRVDARPEKRFFVEMLVRDIDLAPAIIDLLDNAIDGAKRLRGATAPSFEGLFVKLDISSDRFAIEDNCGGISRQHAHDYAFKFGRPSDQQPVDGEVGQFGVGMKRALFKIGRDILVGSRHDGDAFAVPIEVNDWLTTDEWDFPLEELGDRPPSSSGVRIGITDLLPSVQRSFGQAAFVSRLRAEIEIRHVEALERGLEITVDGIPLEARPPTLLIDESAGVAPLVVHHTIPIDGDQIDMHLWAGLSSSTTDDTADTDDPDGFRGTELAGWYLACNDRMLLWADRSRRTGWGEEVPRYHPQYRRFRGYVSLTGKSAHMPWNTAKTDIEEDSPVWAYVRREMIKALRQAVTAMNRVKREVKQRPADDRPLVHALERAEPRRIQELPARDKIIVPPAAPKITADAVKIAYQVPREVFGRVQDALEDARSAPDVGRATFAYFVRREIDPDYE